MCTRIQEIFSVYLTGVPEYTVGPWCGVLADKTSLRRAGRWAGGRARGSGHRTYASGRVGRRGPPHGRGRVLYASRADADRYSRE